MAVLEYIAAFMRSLFFLQSVLKINVYSTIPTNNQFPSAVLKSLRSIPFLQPCNQHVKDVKKLVIFENILSAQMNQLRFNGSNAIFLVCRASFKKHDSKRRKLPNKQKMKTGKNFTIITNWMNGILLVSDLFTTWVKYLIVTFFFPLGLLFFLFLFFYKRKYSDIYCFKSIEKINTEKELLKSSARY